MPAVALSQVQQQAGQLPDKTPQRQRVYDYLYRAKELIAAAYPPETDRS